MGTFAHRRYDMQSQKKRNGGDEPVKSASKFKSRESRIPDIDEVLEQADRIKVEPKPKERSGCGCGGY